MYIVIITFFMLLLKKEKFIVCMQKVLEKKNQWRSMDGCLLISILTTFKPRLVANIQQSTYTVIPTYLIKFQAILNFEVIEIIKQCDG